MLRINVLGTGIIGRIHLLIPLKRLRSEPWVITLEKLRLVISPLSVQDVRGLF